MFGISTWNVTEKDESVIKIVAVEFSVYISVKPVTVTALDWLTSAAPVGSFTII